INEVFRIIDAGTREPTPNPVEQTLTSGQVVHVPNDTVLVRADGAEVAIDDSGAPIRDRDGDIVGAVLVFYDISKGAQKGQHLLSHHATHDSLTQLVNRREFERRLNQLLTSAREEGGEHALCYLDLDQFKVVNDTCGHLAGDRLLQQLSYLLSQRVPDKDTLARLGGDEFGLLLVDCPRECAQEILEQLLQVIRDFRFVWDGRTFELGASVGMVPLTADTTTGQEALSQADTACFVAKEKGRHRIEVYTPGDNEVARHHTEMHWVSRINDALEHDRLELDCQPILSLTATGPKVERGEVLVRMRDEDGNRVSPADFIPSAERYDLMPHIDQWVIRTALDHLRRYLERTEGDPVLRCNINLSGTTLSQDGLQRFILDQVERSGVPPRLICFEITETAAIANFDQAARLIRALRRPGFRFALDDFGSGLSSFGYLKNLPVDFLKIDGSLVRNIAEDPVAHSMVSAIHAVGRAMGIETVAEFAASDAVVEELQGIGVDHAQGFALGKPVPVAEFFRTD
ncbi:MAG TPA: EAL domain-containing protein, partial [Gammaproteobacteria bacterium]|nr:EAL domain-containing protein [Gammaproteobacteria bacterium]